MPAKEIKISLRVTRLLRLMPASGTFSAREIAELYNKRHPPATKPGEVVDKLSRIPLAKYRLGILAKHELVKVTPVRVGRWNVNFYGITPKGEQYRHDH